MLTSSDNVQDAGGAIEARPASGPRVDASWTTLTRTASASSARSTSRCASHKHHASVVYFRWNPSEELPLQSPEFAATMLQTHQQRVPPRCRPQLRGPEAEETESLRAGDVLTRGVSQVEIFEVCAHRNCQSGLERPGAGHAMQAGRPNLFLAKCVRSRGLRPVFPVVAPARFLACWAGVCVQVPLEPSSRGVPDS